MLAKIILPGLFFLLLSFKGLAQFTSITSLEPVEISASTGEKPQSKVWFYAGKYWAVLPNNDGTQLWRLDGAGWTSVLQLSTKKTSKADCKMTGSTAHILLYQGRSSQLVSVEYVQAAGTYQLWSQRPATVNLNFESGVETATIDIDGTGRMWLASDGSESVYVRWSDSPYSTWSAPITIADNITGDDISSIIAMPGKTGIFWSNQNTQRFGFRTHLDGDAPEVWSADEVPASQSAQDYRGGMADDHMNLAVASDGTLYCAVKTSYDSKLYPRLVLLVRRPNGTWDDLYKVSQIGTRPIVILDEEAGKISFIYTSAESGGDILYNESPMDNIAFGGTYVLISGFYNNPTSTKANFTGETLVLASSNTQAVGVLASSPTRPLPVELLSFSAKRSGDDAILDWATATESDNNYFSIEASADGASFTSVGKVRGNGTTAQAHRYTFADQGISRYGSARIYYRLRQVDFSGKYTLSPVRVVYPGRIPETLALEAFPNPFSDHLQVIITSQQQEEAMLSMYSPQGKVIYNGSVLLNRGQTRLPILQVAVPGGVYFLSVRTATDQRIIKLVQQ